MQPPRRTASEKVLDAARIPLRWCPRVDQGIGHTRGVERYEFESGFVADMACKQTAEAYMPAVQNLIGKIVRSPGFKGLLQ